MVNLIEPKNVLKVTNLTLSKDGKTILDAIDFELVEAELCYLIGATGSGKSSFLKLLFGIDRYFDGQINLAGFDLRQISEQQLFHFRRKIGMVFQDFKLFNDWTTYQNLYYVLAATDWKDKLKINKRIDEVLEQVDLIDQSNILVQKLSGGEQQRLAIGRAICNYPSLLIADEPTASLDENSSSDILLLIKQLTDHYRMATLLSTHDLGLIKKFPARVFELKDQKLKELLF